jgi:hypothetical protein
MSLLLDLDGGDSGNGGRARAEYDYVAAEDNELSLREGQNSPLLDVSTDSSR